jgi:hypothetical protein
MPEMQLTRPPGTYVDPYILMTQKIIVCVQLRLQ